MKHCNKCDRALGLAMFHKDKSKRDGLRTTCIDCKRSSDNRWRAANRDKVLLKMKEYYEDNSEVIIERGKQWRLDNPDKFKATTTAYRLNNPDKCYRPYAERVKTNPNHHAVQNNVTARRRATKLNATPPWLSNDQQEMIKDTYVACVNISTETGVPHQVDHIIPLQGVDVCGLHVPWNLQIITATANQSKGNRYEECSESGH